MSVCDIGTRLVPNFTRYSSVCFLDAIPFGFWRNVLVAGSELLNRDRRGPAVAWL